MGNKFTAVTTCSAAGWKEYGQRMVESFHEFWPADVGLLIYSEDELPVPTVQMPNWLPLFKARHIDDVRAHGLRGPRYDFRWDCVKFAHKVAAVTDAASKLDDGVLIWLDADIVTHALISEEWLTSLLPEGPYIGWLDRAHSFPECGFYMLRCSHRWHQKIMRKLAELYQNDQVFNCRETHDSFVLQKLITEWKSSGSITVHSLSGDVGRSTTHPLVNSPLAACLDHLKGPRKAEGRSRQGDLLVPRAEKYWLQPNG